MRLIILPVLIVMMGFTACSSAPEQGQGEVVQTDFNGLEPLLHKDNDTVYVINFWATWCKPCLEELPGFEKLDSEYKGRNVKVILVSLDFPNRYQDQLLPFIKQREMQTTVVHLTEVNANNWIDRVDPSWSGAIPATLVYKGDNKDFYERKLSYQELKDIVELKLK